MCCFCRCYDVKNAPPLKMYIKYRDNEFSLHSRDERVLDALKVFSDGLFNALQRNASQRSLIQEPPDNGQSSYWNYTKSYLEYPVRGIRNFVGKRLLSQNWKTVTSLSVSGVQMFFASLSSHFVLLSNIWMPEAGLQQIPYAEATWQTFFFS